MQCYVCGLSQQTQNICITFVQRRPNVFDVGPTLYKCYANDLCLLGCACTMPACLFWEVLAKLYQKFTFVIFCLMLVQCWLSQMIYPMKSACWQYIIVFTGQKETRSKWQTLKNASLITSFNDVFNWEFIATWHVLRQHGWEIRLFCTAISKTSHLFIKKDNIIFHMLILSMHIYILARIAPTWNHIGNYKELYNALSRLQWYTSYLDID